MSMWLQTRTVRHLTSPSPVGALCGATPRMWFQQPAGTGRFVFDNPETTSPVNKALPICTRCRRILDGLNRAAR